MSCFLLPLGLRPPGAPCWGNCGFAGTLPRPPPCPHRPCGGHRPWAPSLGHGDFGTAELGPGWLPWPREGWGACPPPTAARAWPSGTCCWTLAVPTCEEHLNPALGTWTAPGEAFLCPSPGAGPSALRSGRKSLPTHVRPSPATCRRNLPPVGKTPRTAVDVHAAGAGRPTPGCPCPGALQPQERCWAPRCVLLFLLGQLPHAGPALLSWRASLTYVPGRPGPLRAVLHGRCPCRSLREPEAQGRGRPQLRSAHKTPCVGSTVWLPWSTTGPGRS